MRLRFAASLDLWPSWLVMSEPEKESNSLADSPGSLRLAGLLAEKSILLEKVGIRSALAEIEWMLCHLLELDRLHLYLDGEKLLTDDLLDKLDQLIERRLTRYPLQFILQESWFYGRRFFVNEQVMAPTPETERLCEIAIGFCEHRQYETPRILDVGTGSGVIALTLASELPNCQVVALDISDEALAVARKNAETFGLTDRVRFYQSDFFQALSGNEKKEKKEKFDLILSNPPYIAEPDYAGLDPEVRADPKIAMTAGDEGMDCITRLVADAPNYLAPGGRLMFEIGYNQAEKVARLTDGDSRYKSYALAKDLNDLNRCIILGCDETDE